MRWPFVTRARHDRLIIRNKALLESHRLLKKDFEELFCKYYKLLKKQPKRDKKTGRFVSR